MLVFAAASTADAVAQAAEQFEAETGLVVTVSAASSGMLAQQIRGGARPNLYLAAHPEWVDALADEGLVSEARELLGNRLVIVLPTNAERGQIEPEALADAAFSRIALGDPEVVPAGRYARDALVSQGLWDAVEPKVIPTADVRQALLYVERGEVDAGVVYATDAALTEGIRVAANLDGASIRYSLALLDGSESRTAARRFFEYLQSAEAGSVFLEFGFLPL